ncbi:ATP-binding cassette domain-containing protein [Thomasclavelia ramosa]|uniref:ATP-binding cassette domain-containing protein n=1 Tax=Thomasclavelia ramosa TaxID=1547 RepID=UPI0032C18758
MEEVLEKVKLNNTGKKKFKQFSLGMKQRLGIALVILNNPDFIILDEPINGLDPLGISEIRETLLQLQQENITILISSHILSELYLVANKFGILEGGKIVKELSKEQLDNECSRCLLLKVNDIKKASVLLEEELKTANYKVLNDQEIRLYDYLDAQHIVSKAIVEKGIELYAISEIGVSLEEYFKNIIRDGE